MRSPCPARSARPPCSLLRAWPHLNMDGTTCAQHKCMATDLTFRVPRAGRFVTRWARCSRTSASEPTGPSTNRSSRARTRYNSRSSNACAARATRRFALQQLPTRFRLSRRVGRTTGLCCARRARRAPAPTFGLHYGASVCARIRCETRARCRQRWIWRLHIGAGRGSCAGRLLGSARSGAASALIELAVCAAS